MGTDLMGTGLMGTDLMGTDPLETIFCALIVNEFASCIIPK